jgi:hypothetical protein
MKNIVLVLILLISACSSIDRKSQIDNHKLQVGTAVKSHVVDQIGLPNKVEKRNGQEFWLYSGKEIRSDLFIPLPFAAVGNGAGSYQVFYDDIGPSQELDFKPILVCVFDKNNTLINAFNPQLKGQQ